MVQEPIYRELYLLSCFNIKYRINNLFYTWSYQLYLTEFPVSCRLKKYVHFKPNCLSKNDWIIVFLLSGNWLFSIAVYCNRDHDSLLIVDPIIRDTGFHWESGMYKMRVGSKVNLKCKWFINIIFGLNTQTPFKTNWIKNRS